MTILLLAATLSATPGDMNEDGAVDLGDAVYLLSYVFLQGPPPPAPAGALATESDRCPYEEMLYDVAVPCPGETEISERCKAFPASDGCCMGDRVVRFLLDCELGEYAGGSGGSVPWYKALDGGYRAGQARAYRDEGDGTVTDLATGLQWSWQPVATDVPLPRAVQACEASTLAGHNDWRLPTVAELLTLVDWRGRRPAIAAEFDTGSGSRVFWSSTPFVRDRSDPFVEEIEFWVVDFASGRTVEATSTSIGSVRAVRGGVTSFATQETGGARSG